MIIKIIRYVLGKILLTLDALFKVTPLERTAELQKIYDQETLNFSIFELKTCPFCIKVSRVVRRLALNIELKDVTEGSTYRHELIKEGGEFQVPCLKIKTTDGKEQWMYESSEIIKYLESKFSKTS